jgi:hypothetical protein
MGSQPGEAEWEHVVGHDLVPHLLPAAQLGRADRPPDMESLPEGAYPAIVASVGRVGLEDLLAGPAVAWRMGRWHRRCLYSPPCVAGSASVASDCGSGPCLSPPSGSRCPLVTSLPSSNALTGCAGC